MRKILAVGLLLSAAGCMPRLATEAKPNRDIGVYWYNIQTHRPDMKLEGALAVLPDSVVVTPENDVCWRVADAPKGDRYQAFKCSPPPHMSNFRLVIDANHPGGSTWEIAKTYPVTRKVCVAFAVNKDGQRVCKGYSYQTTFADSIFRGRLEIKRTSAE